MDKDKNILSHTSIACAVAMLCCLLWGSAFPAVKTGFRLLGLSQDDAASQILFAGIRFMLAGAMVIALCCIKSRRFVFPDRNAVPKVIKISLFQTIIQYFFYYTGIAHTSGVKASVLIGANAFFALLVSAILYRTEKLTPPKLIGCAVGFFGVLVINFGGTGGFSGFSLNGEGFILISTIASAFSSTLMKRFSADENPMMLSGWQFFFGGVVLTVFGAAAGGRIYCFDYGTVILLIYLAFVSAAAYTLWAALLKYNPVSKIAVYGLMNPVFGVLLSALFLGETGQAFNLKSLAALILVCAGIYIVNRRNTTEE